MWVEEYLEPLLPHRRKGHVLRFQPRDGVAKVYCFECRKVLLDGDRNMIHEVFEAALQWPADMDGGLPGDKQL